MSLRRPAAHLRRAPGWRRSGDESYWERLTSEDVLTPAAHRQRAPRPQSAVEGRQLDDWLEHLRGLQSNLAAATFNDRMPVVNNRTASMPAFDKEPAGRAWRQLGIPSFSRRSSSCGSSSHYESSLGSQESLQTGLFSPPESRESWERAHIAQAPRKERPQMSCLGQVKTGWLPIQRRVMMMSDAGNHNQTLDHSPGQVKLKQPITPIFQKTRAASKAQDGEMEKSHSTQSFSGGRTQQPPDPDSPNINQMPKEGDRAKGWHVLRRSWNTHRASAVPGGAPSTEPPAGTGSDPDRKPALVKTTSLEPLNHASLHQTASTEPWRPHTPLQGPNNTDTTKSHTPFNRKSSVQPMRVTAPMCRTNSQLSHIQTSSAVTTLVPQNRAGFSSITISSRKVSRSASLPGSPSPPPAYQHVDPNSRQVTVQQKATVVRVKEQRVLCSPALTATTTEGTPAPSHGLDTVVHRRKATIIKVTEHRESYSPAEGERPGYRHSYTEGLYENNSTWSRLDSPERPNSASAPNASTSESETNGGTRHRSTLSLFLSNPPAKAAPTASEDSLKAVGRRSDRPRRPLSWYGNALGHTEPSGESATQPEARKWSFGLQQEAKIDPVNCSFISTGIDVKGAGQLVAENVEENAEDPERRASPCLTLIKAPDPHSHQTPEEVLALNAAAIIANIKLQRQLSKKKTQNGTAEKDSAASPQGNAVTDEGKNAQPRPDQSPVRRHSRPPAVFMSLSLDPVKPPETFSLQEALRTSRPDFISRSQGRVRELERRTLERRELANVTDPQSDAAVRQKRTLGAWSASLKDNLLKPRDRAITGREMHLRSKHSLVEVKRKKEEEKKREVCLTNRQRVVNFKKKLLDQILQRSNN